MPNNLKKFIILSVIIISCLTIDTQCQKGQIKIKQNCINCNSIPNTIPNNSFNGDNNKCICDQQFQWSDSQLQCLPIINSKTAKISTNDVDSQKIPIQPSRLLQLTCDTAKGFLQSNSICVNCRVIPFALGNIFDTNTCNCAPSFTQSGTNCKCKYTRYIDGRLKKCIPCSYYAYTTGNSASQCISCNALPFVSTKNNGCINCLTLANNGGSSSCCATGYIFDSNLALCICDKAKGYSLGQNGFCSACASGDTNCKNCVKNYVNNGFICVYGGRIPNYNLTTSACATGYTFKKDIPYGRIVSCACSKAAQYYQSGNNCISCSSSLPSGVKLASCQSCSSSAGFYAGTVECIYCPNVPFSAGTATINGCDCLPNYFWNLNIGKCQCDYNMGLVGGAISTCINCTSILYTDTTVFVQTCSCLDGHKWDSATKTCICDLSHSAAFVANGVCYNCLAIEGSYGIIGSDKLSCVCIGGFYWNYGLNKCLCDSIQNFAIFDGECNDCLLNPKTIGVAYNQQCVCDNGYIWDSKSACICPSGNVLIGKKCTPCSSITLPSNSQISDCNTCNNAKGYASFDGICALCSSQSLVSSSAVTNGKCTCPPNMFWAMSVGGCACNWEADIVTKVNSDGSYTCFAAKLFWNDGSGKAACGWSYLLLNSRGNICTDFRTDPNNVVNNGVYSCKAGFIYSEETFPFKCVPGGPIGQYYAKGNNGAAPTYSLCTSLSGSTLQNACAICDFNQGFLMIYNKNMCVYCPTVPGASGSATQSSCICTNGNWNPLKILCDTKTTCTSGYIYNPNTQKCDICDPIRSVTIGSKCISCKADSNSNGFAASSTACACKNNFNWSASNTGGQCSSSSCSTITSININGNCFPCPTTNSGTGTPNGTAACGCRNGFVWIPTSSGGSCSCSGAILANGTCFTCPINANTTGQVDPSGGCLCNSNYVWNNQKVTCICDSTINGYITESGLCFRCISSVDPRFSGTIVTNNNNLQCSCKNNYLFVATDKGGSCACTSPSVVVSGNCLTCPINDNTTGQVVGSQCQCNNKYIWSSSQGTCICDQTVFAYISDSGYCFQCSTTNDPNFDKTVVNGEACNCKNQFTFNSTNIGGSCICPSPNTVTNGVCSKCPINANTTGNIGINGGCECKNNYFWSDTKLFCYCDASLQSYITSSGACFTCTTDYDPNFTGSLSNGVCYCANEFKFVGNSTGGVCSCLPTTTSFVDSTGICFTCPSNSLTTGAPDGKGGCACKGTLIWDTTQKTCICGGAKSVTLSNGTCFICGAKDSYTNSTTSKINVCQCTSSLLTWNSALGLCDCGKTSAMIIQSNSFVCVACNSTIRAKSKKNAFSCNCQSKNFIWNTVTSQCDCGLTAVLVSTKCVPCSSAINANGLNVKNSSTCNCLISSMKWNTKTNSCTCNQSQVTFTAKDKSIRCVSCDVSINAKNKSKQTVCNCHSSSFKWVANKGCVCVNSTAIITLINNIPQCLSCNLDTFSSGPADDGKSCVCLGELVWNPKTISCGCSSNSSAISYSGRYFCSACQAKNFSKTPILNKTSCTCTSNVVKWYPEGYCACPDITASVVVVGAKSSLSCVKCDSSINAVGKTSPDQNTCTCVDPVLTYSNGICDCGAGQALIQQGQTNFFCVVCNNGTAYLKAKISPRQCSCVSTALIWNNITGVCYCQDANQIVYGSGSSANCSTCNGQYTTIPKTISTCSCAGTGLVFVASKTSPGSCACRKNQILTLIFTCLACPNSNNVTSPYQCTCPKNSFWHGFNYTCIKCSNIANTNSTGGNIFACQCNSGYVWDVMTLTCIRPCTAGGSSCMNCNISFTTGDSAFARTIQSGLTGSSSIGTFINASFTNYATISSFQCPCLSGFKWDAIRLRCFDQNLV